MATVKITLQGRHPDPFGANQWHDALVLENALNSLAEGKQFSEAAMWAKIAGRLHLQMGRAGLTKIVERSDGNKVPDLSADITLDLHGAEPELLWRELMRLKVEQFRVKHVGLVWIMLESIGAELGKKLPEADAE